jgi:hypothetical protein
MTTPVSRTASPTQQSEQPAEEKSNFAKRVSSSFNFNQAIALVVIGSLVFLPLGAAGLAFAMPRAEFPPGLQTSNATCPPLQISPAVIQAYLRGESSHYYSSAAAREIDGLQLEDFKEMRYDSEQIQQRRLNEKKSELLKEAADDFLKTADSEDHPAAKAVALHQAKEVLKQAQGLAGPNKISQDLYTRVEGLRVEEADACHESAKLAETPEEKLSWATRGLLELNIPLNPYEANTFYLRDNLPACDAASVLFYSAAQAFKQLDPHKYYDYAALIRPNRKPIFTAQPQLAAAECLKRAAHYSRNSEDAQVAFDEAIDVMKSIFISSLSLEDQVEVQDRIISTSIAAYSTVKGTHPELSARIFSESMMVEKMYQQLIESTNGTPLATDYTIQRALSLENAAYYAHNLTRALELYSEARDIVQTAWSQHPDECLMNRDFALKKHSLLGPLFSIQDSLLSRLQRSVLIIEKQLAQQSQGIFRSLWNRVSVWLY